MADTNTETIEKKDEIASRGSVKTMTVGAAQQQDNADQDKEEKPAGADNPPPPTPELSDEQLKAFFESKGMKYEGLDNLKEKINYVAPENKPELTEEQKAAAVQAEEKRMLDYYIANGGTIDSFAGLKSILNADLTELSIAEITGDMLKNGFTQEEVDSVLKERYYQIKEDEIEQAVQSLEQGTDEEDADFAKRQEAYKASLQKKIAFGASKITGRGTNIKSKAEAIFNGLKEALQAEDLEKQKEVTLQSNVDKALANLPRKFTLQLGKHDDVDIAPIDHEVSDESIASVSALLKDSAQRKQLLYNQDDSLNVDKLAEILVRNAELERVAKLALLEGGTRQVAIIKKTFGSNPQEIGVGGSGRNPVKTGQVTQRGATQRVK